MLAANPCLLTRHHVVAGSHDSLQHDQACGYRGCGARGGAISRGFLECQRCAPMIYANISVSAVHTPLRVIALHTCCSEHTTQVRLSPGETLVCTTRTNAQLIHTRGTGTRSLLQGRGNGGGGGLTCNGKPGRACPASDPCFDKTKEVTVNADGSTTVTIKNCIKEGVSFISFSPDCKQACKKTESVRLCARRPRRPALGAPHARACAAQHRVTVRTLATCAAAT